MKFSTIILGEFWFKLLNNSIKQSVHYYFIALTLHDANAKNRCTGKSAQAFALNGSFCAQQAVKELRNRDPNLDTDQKTKELEDCVFENLGGGFATGGTVGAAVGTVAGGPVGAAAGAALGAAGGSVAGAAATALNYCCSMEKFSCQKQG